MTLTMNWKDIGAGLFFIAVGLLYGGLAWTSLPIGIALSMGPGYFPLILSGILIFVGLILIGLGLVRTLPSDFGPVPWRGVFMLSLSIIVFGTFIRQLGLFPIVFVTCFLVTLSTDLISWRSRFIISISVAVLTTAIFIYGVNVPLPVLGSRLIQR